MSKTSVASKFAAANPEAAAFALIEAQKTKLKVFDTNGDWSYELHRRGESTTHTFGLKKGPGLSSRMEDAAVITIGREVGKEGWYVYYSWNGRGSEDKKAGFPQLVARLKKTLNG